MAILKTDLSFFLEKWFLDFVSEDNEILIVYVARMVWKGISVPYKSLIHYDPAKGKVTIKSKFSNLKYPELNNEYIVWEDKTWKWKGVWESRHHNLRGIIHESEKGNLTWEALQPVSSVEMMKGGELLKGEGYVEKLVLSDLPWNIPMDELRWGRFIGNGNSLVWIELREKQTKQWVWWNGVQVIDCEIEDYEIKIPSRGVILKMDRNLILENEKKLFSVVQSILKFIPGFKRNMPLHFLMADETKWFSHCTLGINGLYAGNGHAIHELVKFK